MAADRRARRSARQADQDEFLESVIPRLMGLAMAMTGQRADAEDLVQETLAKAIVHRSKVARADHPDAYLRTMLVNQFCSRRRRRASSEVVSDEVVKEYAPPVTADHSQQVINKDHLAHLLSTVTPRQRAVLALRYYDDLPDSAIAHTLGCSSQAVRNLAHAGLRTLRTRVAQPETAQSETGEGPA